MSDTQANKNVILRFISQVWNAGNLALADALVHPEYVVPGIGQGPEAVKHNVRVFRDAFPDLIWEVQDIVAEEDRVAVRMTLHATHHGVFRGIAPTGRRISMQEMAFWRIVEGRLHTGWFQADMLGLRDQLGALANG